MAIDYFGILKGLFIRNDVDPSKQAVIEVTTGATANTSTTIQLSQTADRTIVIPDASTTLVGTDTTQTLTSKTIDGDNNTVQDLALSSLKTDLANANKILARDGSGVVVSSASTLPTGQVVGTTDSQTLTNKTIDGDDNTVQDLALTSLKTNLGHATSFLQRDASGIVVSGTKTVPTGDVVGTSDSQSLTNKTLNSTNTVTLSDSNFTLTDNVDATKQLQLQLSGLTTGTTRTLSAPDISDTLITRTSTDQSANRLQNKHLDNTNVAFVDTSDTSKQIQFSSSSQLSGTTTILSTSSSTNRTLTFPNATTTLVGTDVTQTLSNKTLGDALTTTQISTPSNPSAGFNKLYTKSGDDLYLLTSTGVEKQFATAVSNLNVSTKTTSYTAVTTDDVLLLDSTGGGFIVDLYTAIGNTGRQLILKKISSDNNNIVIDPSLSQTIDGNTTITLRGQYDSIVIVSDGSNWQVVNSDITIAWAGYHTNGSWSRTNTSYGNPNTDPAASLVQTLSSNFNTVTTFSSSGNPLPGITFTPTKTGTYRLTCKFPLYGASAGHKSAARLTDGTTSFSESAMVAPGNQYFQTVELHATTSLVSSVSKTFRIETKNDSGAVTIGNTNYTTRIVEWSIIRLGD